MLSLKSSTENRWLALVDQDLEAVLIDHAHCEKKAAAAALNFLSVYSQYPALCREMAAIVIEEMEHYQQVLDLLAERQIRFGPQKPSNYGKQLHALVRPQEPQRVVDRLLVAGLIEARSCERFSKLAEHVQDPALATFYRSLFESEARHHSTYVRLAKLFASPEAVDARLDELATAEAQILAVGDTLPRMHS